ncbi:YciC family protein [Pseudomonas lundensis]|uniref:YciC family protein n=1 Tax=Serratia proteamaculans TaxID=28151 RepID=UPI002981C644|nr:YciC family protein [Serratia proteamaculans]MDW5498456.1 YciC family protein [Serratia proteamaculans]MDW5503516.1 YciC family protein [Pseudomonas lundensis]
MPITANTLYRDSFNFFRNQLTSILMLALLTAFISVLLNQAFSPDVEQLKILSATEGDFAASAGMGIQEIIQQMTPEQQMVLLKVSAAATFSALVGNVLLVGGMLTLIHLVSQGQRISALRAIGASAPQLPRLLLLLFICTLLIQLGLTLFVVPGVLMAIAFSLAPVITATDNKGVFASIKLSCKLAFANARVIVPAMMLWLAAKLLVLFLVSHLSVLTPNVASVVLTALSNLVSALLLIYLFRLYMLLRS